MRGSAAPRPAAWVSTVRWVPVAASSQARDAKNSPSPTPAACTRPSASTTPTQPSRPGWASQPGWSPPVVAASMALPMASGSNASGTVADTLNAAAMARVPGIARSNEASSAGAERARELGQ
ncbi:MAG TPA: hypothetical protein VGH72_24020 [Pseudonocardia sp.]